MFQYLVLAVLTVVAMADYDCICNYNVQYAVYGQPADNSDTLGYLYEFDCKEKLPGSSTAKYTAIAFQHTVGYVITNDETQSQVCPGDPSSDDMLTTTSMPMSASRKMESTTTDYTNSMTSTPAPTTAKLTTFAPTTTPTATQSTTTTPTTTPSTTSAPTETTSKAGSMAMSTTPPSTAMYTDKPVPTNQINLCSSNLRTTARLNGYYIGQYNQTCYLLRPGVKSNWSPAERYCKSHGGTLFDISNVEEQDYIMSFLKSHNFQDEVWMGLNDKGHEERFTWTSGEQLTYTNWYPYRKDDIDEHSVEDCGVLVPFAPFNGQWDDLHCGTTLNFGTKQHAHSYICQFHVHGSTQSFLSGLIG